MTKDDPKNLGRIWVWLAGALRMASHKSMTSSNILIKIFVLKFYGQPSVVFFLGTHERAPQDNFYDVISKVNLVFHVHQGTYQSG
jgi:hypothetical protein